MYISMLFTSVTYICVCVLEKTIRYTYIGEVEFSLYMYLRMCVYWIDG